ncbi:MULTISPECIES: ATP-dependent RNA helicase DbpA [unclassified Colwellia]|uniref:ATP-dependent RNA helicase DbpA n=1 Tax=unclassified Colwellia TaxID=196834 RepID=UPI000D3D1D25|nr:MULTISPECIES: ATP-dependent RNA helicase DbpA [unclassified Colwellia]AWB58778.1 ATP-dependent RNA helicase DbpA [Colwellia sp. Arc7-D]MBA6414761.1 ATP-dependent RNA helicase DbpA [Colwellia sp. 6M3]
MSDSKFSSLTLQSAILENLSSLGYHEMTEIQAKSLPAILAGQDVIAQGKTGSGKTAAFGLGLLNKLQVKKFRIQTLVLCPTRELADQVAKEIRKLARAVHNIKVLTLCGGTPFGPQVGSLEHGAHIIVGTPGRIEDHLGRGTLSLDHVDTLVLDEADRMLDMGFQAALDNIIDKIPQQRQTLLFSATFPDQIQKIANKYLQTPAVIKVESNHENSTISQHFYQVENDEDRLLAIRLLLLTHKPESSVIFCNTKIETQNVANKLAAYGFGVVALHGDLEQKDRDQTLVRFANKSASILVATDVAARGLDIEALDAVFNYNLAHDTEVHIHRIGRTGRAGSTGYAFTLFSNKDRYKIGLLEDYLERTIEGEELPSNEVLEHSVFTAKMATIQIDGGKKQKVRPGDIVGALTSENGITFEQVGKIQLGPNWAYVAVEKMVARKALNKLTHGKLKGRTFRVRELK